MLVGTPSGDAAVHMKDAGRPLVFTVEKALADDLQRAAAAYRARDLFAYRMFDLTRLVVEHTAATNRALLHQRLLQGFAVKAVFFAVYVVVMLRGLHLQPLPFVVSFTSAFIVLHVTEAILLQRLTVRHTPSIAS